VCSTSFGDGDHVSDALCMLLVKEDACRVWNHTQWLCECGWHAVQEKSTDSVRDM
jgi:hypothetical protein